MGAIGGFGGARVGRSPRSIERYLALRSRYRWFVVAVFFLFVLLHQADKLLIGPLTTPIMETFGIDEERMGRVFTGALVVGGVFYPLWGYLFDRFSRSKLLGAASFLWGATTWLSAIAPSYPAFLASRASTGIDDSSYPGIFSLLSDYFEPRLRGRVYGLLYLTMPLGYLVGMLLAMQLGAVIGWRSVFYVTGALGVLLSALIFFGVREVPRGNSEPELAQLEQVGHDRFDWRTALNLFRKPTLLVMFVQGFFGVIPWNVITYWFFRYLEVERHYGPDEVLLTMVVAVLVLAAGYFVGGAIGDFFFKRTPKGRLAVAGVAVLLGAFLLLITLNVPLDNHLAFGVMLSIAALFIPFAAPNAVSTIHDITLPEVRGTALSVQYFCEGIGAALAPWLAGLVAVRSSLHDAILVICVSSWVICSIFFVVAAHFIPRDVGTLRSQMAERARRQSAARA